MNTHLRKLSFLSAAAASVALVPSASAIIATGDIAIVGVNAQSNGQIAVVALKNIDAGTVINFTDTAWVAANSAFETALDFENNPYRPEGIIQYTTGAIAEGTVIYLDTSSVWNDPGGSVVHIVDDGTDGVRASGFHIPTTSGEAGIDFVGTGAPLFDQILVYTGTDDFVYGVNFGPSTGWEYDDSGIWGNEDYTSDLPSALTIGDTSMTLWSVDPNDQDGEFNVQDPGNWYYSGITTGTPEQLRAAIANPDNWTFNTGAMGPTNAYDFGQLFEDGTFDVIPEPATYAAWFGALALGMILLRRRMRN